MIRLPSGVGENTCGVIEERSRTSSGVGVEVRVGVGVGERVSVGVGVRVGVGVGERVSVGVGAGGEDDLSLSWRRVGDGPCADCSGVSVVVGEGRETHDSNSSMQNTLIVSALILGDMSFSALLRVKM